tara:strand:+ start:19280 stop:19438 length:159 start_codon:yes stop_codon:yes gene_type:complete
MPKPRNKTINWKQYKQSIINRGSLTFWVAGEVISEWVQANRISTGGHVSSAI